MAVSRDTEQARRGIDEAARRLRESSQRGPKPLTQEQARRRVVEAVTRTERRQQGG